MAWACGGFLPFNLPKDRVFMGDVGSILLGFVYACLVVCFAKTFGDFVVLIGFLFPFYADELVIMYVRIRDGQSLTLPHRRHLYQLIANELNISHWKVSAAFGVLAADRWRQRDGHQAIWCLAGIFFAARLFYDFYSLQCLCEEQGHGKKSKVLNSNKGDKKSYYPQITQITQILKGRSRAPVKCATLSKTNCTGPAKAGKRKVKFTTPQRNGLRIPQGRQNSKLNIILPGL